MAHLMKLKSAQLGGILHHNRRDREATLERDNVDRSLTKDNYELVPDCVEIRLEEVRASHEVAAGRAVRSDAVVACSWVVTSPRDMTPDREREFFEQSVAFAQARYGRENVVQATVHCDEPGRNHLHVIVIPERDGKLQASKVMNRADLQTWHRDLDRHIEREMGCRYSVQVEHEHESDRRMNRLDMAEWREAQDSIRRAQEQAREAQEQAREAQERAARDRADAAAEAARLESLRRCREQAEGRVGECRERLAQSRSEGREAVSRGDAAEERVRGLRERLEGLRERFEQAREALDRARERLEALGRKIADARYVLTHPEKIGHARYEAAAVRCGREIGWDRPDRWRDRELDVQLDRDRGIERDHQPSAREMIDMATRAARDLDRHRAQDQYDRGGYDRGWSR